jgi:hypothetical protein
MEESDEPDRLLVDAREMALAIIEARRADSGSPQPSQGVMELILEAVTRASSKPGESVEVRAERIAWLSTVMFYLTDACVMAMNTDSTAEFEGSAEALLMKSAEVALRPPIIPPDPQ